VQTCGEILNDPYDNVLIEAFYFSGDMAEICCNTAYHQSASRHEFARNAATQTLRGA